MTFSPRSSRLMASPAGSTAVLSLASPRPLRADRVETPTDGLRSYLRHIQSIPLLTADEEESLSRAYSATRDPKIADRLVNSHLRLAVKIALGYRRYGLPVEDLIAEASAGLVRAVQKFSPEKGARLSTYAQWWIKASLHEYILANWSLVKVSATAPQKKLFYHLNKTKRALGITSAALDAQQAQDIADRLEVRPQDVQAMNARMNGRDLSLNAPLNEDADSSDRLDLLPDERANQEEALARQQSESLAMQMVQHALSSLSERDRDIVSRRHLSETPETLETLSQDYNISRERVRQIESRALSKLKQQITSDHRWAQAESSSRLLSA